MVIFKFNITSFLAPILGLIGGWGFFYAFKKEYPKENYRFNLSLIIICIYVNSIILGYGLIIFIFFMYLKAEFIFFRLVSLFFLIVILIILSLHSIFIVSKNKLQKEIKYGRFRRDPNSISKEEIERIQRGLAEVKVDYIIISNRFKPLHFIFRNDKDKQIAYELRNELNKLKKKLIGIERNLRRLPTISCFAGLWKEHYKQRNELISLRRKIRKYLAWGG